jgi:hypothetical protein
VSLLGSQKDVRRTLLCTEEMGAGGPFGSTLVSFVSAAPCSPLLPPPRVRVVVWYSMRVQYNGSGCATSMCTLLCVDMM